MDGRLYVFIRRKAPGKPTPGTFNVTVFEDQSLYSPILTLGSVPNGAILRVVGEGDSTQFFGTFDSSLQVIKPLTSRRSGQNR